MKTLLFFLLSIGVLASSRTAAQDYKADVTQQFMHYTNLVVKKDFRAAADFIIEDLYALVPREQMIKAMEGIFNTPDFDYKIDSAQILEVGNEQRIDSAHFIKLRYSNVLHMRFGTDSTRADSVLAENELLTLTLQSKFGESNVTYNKASGYYRVLSVKEVVGKSLDLKNWKFIVLEEDKMPFLKKILPKQLLE